jgi:hypothetical protein
VQELRPATLSIIPRVFLNRLLDDFDCEIGQWHDVGMAVFGAAAGEPPFACVEIELGRDYAGHFTHALCCQQAKLDDALALRRARHCVGETTPDGRYQTTLREMISHVVTTEAPIYEDLLVDRIARAHGFQRSGSNIYQIVSKMISRGHARSNDDDRLVIWSNGASPNKPHPFRESRDGIRSHLDVPIAELASLALPFVRLRMSDEEVIRRLADVFQLGRLREGARARFEKALAVAQQTLVS